MSSNKRFLTLALLVLVLAVVFSVTIWPEASLAAKIAFFAMGFGSGALVGQYLAHRQAA